MRENMWLLTFWVWLTSLMMMFSGSIHWPANDNISFFPVAEYNSIVYKNHIFLIHLSVVRHPGYFHSLAIVNSAAVNMGVLVVCYNLTHIPLGIFLRVLKAVFVFMTPTFHGTPTFSNSKSPPWVYLGSHCMTYFRYHKPDLYIWGSWTWAAGGEQGGGGGIRKCLCLFF
jgi:hypothetical protein